MNASELITRIRRAFLGGSQMLRWRPVALSAMIAAIVLGSCGRSPQSTGPDVTENSQVSKAGDNPADFIATDTQDAGAAAEDPAEEAAEALENDSANDQAWVESARAGHFESEYRAGETPQFEAAGQTVVLVGAGDIAGSGSGKSSTAKLVESIPGTVFTAGDNAYSNGSASDYSGKYNPTWGRFKSRTRPAPGNHEYNSSGAKPYYAYFGANAGPAGRGYYSYNIGDWHIVSLNSNISMSTGSAQEKWLKADLAANRNACTLAYWHHPRFSSGEHGSSTKSKGVWQTLYNAGAEVVVVGHDHHYERFAPMTADGQLDPVRGIREFVVGSGGTGHRSVGKIANSEARNASNYGVIKLTLAPGSYKWEFVPTSSGGYRDAGSGTCHN